MIDHSRRAIVSLFMCAVFACATATWAVDSQTRPAENDQQLKSWLQNMAWHHRYTCAEMQQVTGLGADEVLAKLKSSTSGTPPDRPGQ